MKKSISITLLIIFAVLLAISGCTGGEASDSDVLSIKDKNLEEALRTILDKPEGEIYPSDFEGITELDLSDKGIKDITPLSRLTGVTSLYLNKNEISDLSPLSGLNNIRVLVLSQNKIEDITPLSELNGIESLVLGHNEIKDLTPLSDLVTLKLLSLNDNMISVLEPLSVLIGLEVLDLRGNKLTAIDELVTLATMKVLKLNNNRIKDIAPLRMMYDAGAFHDKDSLIDITYNSMEIRPDSDNRAVVDYLIEQGVDVDWKEGNISDKPKEDIG
jgi:Leucine-rich repeat (LRR) protein